MDTKRLTHVDDSGKAAMVDVSGKARSLRTARATGRIEIAGETLRLIRENSIAKGDVLGVARVAGIMAGKKTSELIPLCHGIAVDKIEVSFELNDSGVTIVSTAICFDRTGIEMEALTAVTVAALTIWDMCKAVDKSMAIRDIRLVEKTKAVPEGGGA